MGLLRFGKAQSIFPCDVLFFLFASLTLQNGVRGDIGSSRGKQQNKELAYKTTSITVYNRAWVGEAGLGLCGLGQTGGTPSTYQGSCDRIHSVFLVLFWLGMDLEKQKDGATDMYV